MIYMIDTNTNTSNKPELDGTLFVEHEEDADESGIVGFAGCILMYLDAPSAETSFV